jgi:glycolate oxidase FAD binding subunit
MDLTELIDAVRHPGDDTLNPQGLRTRNAMGSGRIVTAPAGIVEFEPAEMTLRCGAATPLDELHAAVAVAGQELALPPGGTIGGAIAVGRSDVMRRGRGPVRDTLLQVRFVTAAGVEVSAGGPTVKNVSGFDLCRLFVGSRGTLGVLGEIVVRTRVQPPMRAWFMREASPDVVAPLLARPVSVLWDGTTCWVCLEGHPRDVAEEQRRAALVEVAAPPELPEGARWSISPRRWRELCGSGRYVMELGVGVVHHERTPDHSRDPVTVISSRVRELGDRLRHEFDPTRRLNPHLDVYSR